MRGELSDRLFVICSPGWWDIQQWYMERGFVVRWRRGGRSCRPFGMADDKCALLGAL